MGSGSSSPHVSSPPPTIAMDDVQVKELAEHSPIVADRLKALMKPPFNLPDSITAEILSVVEKSWNQVIDGGVMFYDTYKSVEKNPESCIVWFTRKFYMRISELDASSIGLYPTNSDRQIVLVRIMVSECIRCMRNGDNDSQDHIYKIVKRHFDMQVTGKQFKIMCVAVMDTLKYCFDKEYTPEIRHAWAVMFTNLLKVMLKYSIAMELFYLPKSQQSSYASGNSFFDDKYTLGEGGEAVQPSTYYNLGDDDDVVGAEEQSGSSASLTSKSGTTPEASAAGSTMTIHELDKGSDVAK